MPGSAERIVLVTSTTGYRADAFLEAGRKLGADVVVASDRCHVLDKHWMWPADSLVIDFYDPTAAAETIVRAARARPDAPVRAVIAAGGESEALVAALAGQALGLPSNTATAARAARDKHMMRSLCRSAGVPTPRFLLLPPGEAAGAAAARVARELGFPVVLKPLLLSASRGVMRADDPEGFARAHARLERLLAAPAVAALDQEAGRRILVETFIPGREVALEGLLTDGELRMLALFDKPDPLDGPFFEETLYVTPSRLPPAVQNAVREAAADAARAMGLFTGPVHAELRLPPDGTAPVVIEAAARSIGGLCARTLRFGTGLGLEELLVRHALGQPVDGLHREAPAAGVMMIPIPRGGVFKDAAGVLTARAVPGIEDVVITVRPGENLTPLPEGASYLGFIFARGGSPVFVEEALRAAHGALRITVAPTLAAVDTRRVATGVGRKVPRGPRKGP